MLEEAILAEKTKKCLMSFKTDSLPGGTYLGGGTAVALQIGHRRSVDVDFFTPSEFNETQWESKLVSEFGLQVTQKDWQTLIGEIDKVKFSLMGYKYKLIEEPLDLYKIKVAALADLAAMKLEAVLTRGVKRDFIDIFFLGKRFGLVKMFEFYRQKYGDDVYENKYLLIRKALMYFEEADTDEMPDMLVEVSWDTVKRDVGGWVKGLR